MAAHYTHALLRRRQLPAAFGFMPYCAVVGSPYTANAPTLIRVTPAAQPHADVDGFHADRSSNQDAYRTPVTLFRRPRTAVPYHFYRPAWFTHLPHSLRIIHHRLTNAVAPVATDALLVDGSAGCWTLGLQCVRHDILVPTGHPPCLPYCPIPPADLGCDDRRCYLPTPPRNCLPTGLRDSPSFCGSPRDWYSRADITHASFAYTLCTPCDTTCFRPHPT